MQRKQSIDAFGAASLIAVSLILGFNQVAIKFVNEGLQPVLVASIRSAGSALLLYFWMRYRGTKPTILSGTVPAGLTCGFLFAIEFILLFVALDLTSVARTSVIFYTMPFWLMIMAHLAIPGERISAGKLIGLALAFVGVVWVIFDRPSTGDVSLLGDFLALIARISPLSMVEPPMQLFWQVTISAPLLALATPFFGDLVREFEPVHLLGLAFQIVVVASATFVFWFWLLKIYPASGVASFSFLAPVFGVFFGWILLGEDVGFSLLGALVLVALGLVLINRPSIPSDKD